MNRLFCWLLLAAILVEKGEWKVGLEDFGLWVYNNHPIAPKYGDCRIHVSILFTNIPICLCAKTCVPRYKYFCCRKFVLVSKQLIYSFDGMRYGTHVCAWTQLLNCFSWSHVTFHTIMCDAIFGLFIGMLSVYWKIPWRWSKINFQNLTCKYFQRPCCTNWSSWWRWWRLGWRWRIIRSWRRW